MTTFLAVYVHDHSQQLIVLLELVVSLFLVAAYIYFIILTESCGVVFVIAMRKRFLIFFGIADGSAVAIARATTVFIAFPLVTVSALW